jgi:hypothetical protein
MEPRRHAGCYSEPEVLEMTLLVLWVCFFPYDVVTLASTAFEFTTASPLTPWDSSSSSNIPLFVHLHSFTVYINGVLEELISNM